MQIGAKLMNHCRLINCDYETFLTPTVIKFEKVAFLNDISIKVSVIKGSSINYVRTLGGVGLANI